MAGVRQRVKKVLARSSTARSAVQVVRARRSRDVVAGSGLFEAEWYRRQLRDPAAAGDDLLGHYLRHGWAAGLSPSPLFDPTWYRSVNRSAVPATQDPLTHFLLRGARRGASPHPFFDAAWYAEQHPASRSHALGPFGHYRDVGAGQGSGFHPDVDPVAYRAAHPDATRSLLDHATRQAGEELLRTRGFRDVPRQVDSFDVAASERWKTGLLAAAPGPTTSGPLVTVVIPTKDRAAGVVEAAWSVLRQTYTDVQLVIVDDGSTDGTVEALAPVLADPRVELVRREVAGGVSVARNAGLALARGTYVAYLDSDNTWKPDFLEVMVAFVTSRGLRVGYGVSELLGEGQRAYRCTPFDAGALRERNFIDCIVILHERSLLDEVGGFDESLRRMVDWDLMIRMAGVTEFALAPFVATTYDLWEERDDRLTTSEPFGYRYVIKSKRLVDWPAAEASLPQREQGLVSVVVHARGGAALTERCVDRVVERTGGRFEVLVVDTGSTPERALPLQLLGLRHAAQPVRVVRVPDELTSEVAANIGVVASRGEVVVQLACDVLVEDDWLEPLVAPLLAGEAVATQPLVLRASGAVLSAGVAFSRSAQPHHLLAGAAWHAPEAHQVTDPPALTSLALAARAESLVAVRGQDPFYVDAVEGAELSLRLAATGTGPLLLVPDSVVVRREAKAKNRATAPTELDNRRYFTSTWADRLPDVAEDVWASAGYRVCGWEATDRAEGSPGAAAYRPVVVRERAGTPTRWAIKTAVPDVVDRRGWGDYYFAIALRDALRRQGQDAVVDCLGAWYRPTVHDDDVVVVIRGKTPYVANPEHVNLMWAISHPGKVTPREAATFDHVMVASISHAQALARSATVPVEALLQCTDQNLFTPQDVEPGQDVLFVGNSRGVMRHVVRDALEAGLDLRVFGNGWGPFLPPGRLQGTYVPNALLARTYAEAGVVLNDHWDDMRHHGYLSNRLFDLAAVGARVVSDEVDGLSEVFGDVVLTYDSPASLAAAVATQLEDTPERAQARAELSVRVRAEHTFDARAQRLVEAAAPLLAARRAAATR